MIIEFNMEMKWRLYRDLQKSGLDVKPFRGRGTFCIMARFWMIFGDAEKEKV